MAEHKKINESQISYGKTTKQKQSYKQDSLKSDSILQQGKIDLHTLSYQDVKQLQRKIGNQAVLQFCSNTNKSNFDLEQQLIQKKSNNTGLPDSIKTRVENLSGYSMDDVKVHYNSSKPAEVSALAFTKGSDIHVAPGQEKHLPHEAWHVVQQKQGRVQPTFQMKDISINTNDFLEQEADKFENNVAQHLQHKETSQLKSNSPCSSTMQCKSDQPLMTQLRELLPWAMDRIGEARNYDPHFKPLFNKINEYDRSKDGRPRTQYLAICAMLTDLNLWVEQHVNTFQGNDLTNYNKLNEILIGERNVTAEQAKRLEKYSDNPASPYEQMTDEGMLWSQEHFEHSTKKLGKDGKSYFEELSAMNVDSIKAEKEGNSLTSSEWYAYFVTAAAEALSNAVVNHYTTSVRAQAMLSDGGMKSKIMLEKDLPTFKHNTSSYDDFGLGNSGFLFFFIESPNAPLRGTRFAEGDTGADPVRISIPIKESGLLNNGWLMLSDFAQREYPDIMTKKEGDEHTSLLPTRREEQKKKKPEFTENVRHFQPGLSPLGDDDIEKMMSMKDSKKQQAFSAVVPQALGDKDSKQVYTGPNGKLEIPDKLFNNVLVGKDIIPGLANRAGLEVARINAVNPALGKKLQNLRGEALMSFMLKDLFRPQAMIPNSLKIKEEHIQQ